MPPKATKLLERMRRSKANWKRNDIDSLLVGFGFEIKSGSNHDIVSHPEHPHLVTALPRHNKVAKYIVKIAVQLVDQLLTLQETENSDDEENGNDN